MYFITSTLEYEVSQRYHVLVLYATKKVFRIAHYAYWHTYYWHTYYWQNERC